MHAENFETVDILTEMPRVLKSEIRTRDLPNKSCLVQPLTS